MLLTRLTDTATITTVTIGPRSGPFNDPTQATTTATSPALFQQQSTAERLTNEDITTTRGIGFFPPAAVIHPTSKVTFASIPGRSFRVIGDAGAWSSLAGRADHLEVLLEAITSS